MIISRRIFLKTAALSGASLVIGFDGSRLLRGAETAASGRFKPNAWVRIDADGTVTLTIGKSEMGQGVRTSLAMLLAEELEADWSRIKLAQASPGPDFEDLGTGGSDSLRSSWKPLRQAGAAAREEQPAERLAAAPPRHHQPRGPHRTGQPEQVEHCRRCGLRRSLESCGGNHAGAGRRRADDNRDADIEHGEGMSAIFVATDLWSVAGGSQSRGYNCGVTIFAVSKRNIVG